MADQQQHDLQQQDTKDAQGSKEHWFAVLDQGLPFVFASMDSHTTCGLGRAGQCTKCSAPLVLSPLQQQQRWHQCLQVWAGWKVTLRTWEQIVGLFAGCLHHCCCVCTWCLCYCRINNAGTNAYKYGPLLESDDEDLEAIVDTNVLGVMLCCKEVSRLDALLRCAVPRCATLLLSMSPEHGCRTRSSM